MSGSAGNTGYATLQVIPSFRGVTAAMNRELAGIMPGVGAQAGTNMAGSFSASFGRALKIAGPLAAAAFAFGKTLNVARDFEARISAVGAVSGATGGALDQLRSKALQLGAETAFSASESARAMEELVKAGIDVSGVLGGAADATVALAAAGGVDLTTAAEVAANAMNAFGLSAAQMPRIADLVAGAANTSAIGVEDFAYSLQMSGAVANLVGLDFEDLAVGITAMGNAGIKGSDAGTSLKTMLMRLEPQTDTARAAMDQLGITTNGLNNQFFDARGEAKSLAEISGVLTRALEGQTNQQKLATLNTLFGADAIRAAAVLADQGAEGIAKLNDEMAKTSAAEVARQRLDNLNGSLEQFRGSVETLAIKAGSLAIPAVRGLVDSATGFVNLLSTPPDGYFDVLVPAARDLADTGDHLVTVFGDLVDAGRPVVELGAKLGAAGAVAGLTATADVVERFTGVLEDHSTILAVAAGGYLGLKAAALAGSAMTAVTTGALTAGARLEVLALRARTTGAAFATMGANAQLGMTMLGTSVAAGTTLVGALRMATMGAVGGAFLVGDAWSKASAKAQQDIDAIKVKTDDLSPESLRQTANQLREQASAAYAATQSHQGFGGALKSTLELMTPMANTGAENIARLDQMSTATKEADAAYYGLLTRYQQVYALMQGYGRIELVEEGSVERVERWVRLLESRGIDTAILSNQELADQINAVRNAADGATPASETLTEAMRVLADETSNSKDKLDAWKDSLDNALGVKKNTLLAESDFQAALEGLDSQLESSWIKTLDPNNSEGRKNIDAMDDAVEKAAALAAAYGDTYGLDAANQILESTRLQIIETGRAAGLTTDEVTALLDQFGLTPETVQTQVQVSGVDGAAAALEGIQAQMLGLDGMRSTVSLNVQLGGSYLASGVLKALEIGMHGRRHGAVHSYASGGIHAHVAKGDLIRYAEPSTGGEAFIPRLGDRARSTAILRQAAAWYGLDLIPDRRRRVVPMDVGGVTTTTPAGGTSDARPIFGGGITINTTKPTGEGHAIAIIQRLKTEQWLSPSAFS